MTSNRVTLINSSSRSAGRGTLVRKDAVIVDSASVAELLGDLVGVLTQSSKPLRVEVPVDVLSVHVADQNVATGHSVHVSVVPGASPLVALRLQRPVDVVPARVDELPDDIQASVTHHEDGARRFSGDVAPAPTKHGGGPEPVRPPIEVPPELAFFPCMILPGLCQGRIPQPEQGKSLL